MGYKALNWAWQASGLTSTQKFVLVALADMADEANSCFPGQERLAEMTGTSTSSVYRALKALEEAGALIRKPRGVAGGGRTSDRYVLNVTRSICTVRGNRSSEGSKTVTVTDETGHGEGGTPREPSVEPPVLLSTDKSDDAGDWIADDWQPNTKHQDLADSLHLDVVREAARFRAHAVRTRRRLKNWNAGFTNWLNKSAVFVQQSQGTRPQGQTFARQRQDNMLSIVERYQEKEGARGEVGNGEAARVQALN